MNKIIKWITLLKIIYIITVLGDLLTVLLPVIRHAKLDYVYFSIYIDIVLAAFIVYALFKSKTWVLIPLYLELALIIIGNFAIYFGPHGRQLHVPNAIAQVLFQILIIRYLSKKDVKEYFLSQQKFEKKGAV